ncbi:uncharacterized protein C4orf50 homolog [Oxyura jamaicensis]|uniref:uncharacterized protein C4orf50 homolog n=1 Tax=Oxyura jamaicensis TaxID=8884 RepID=UPI0015A5D0E2|nr:uncharacterized protein C4orf50 homolog [Oxyura jamaicensis]
MVIQHVAAMVLGNQGGTWAGKSREVLHFELEDASKPDEQSNSAEQENLNLRIKELEKSEQELKGILEEYMDSDSMLRNRMKELELSHKTLLVMIDQLNVKVHLVENANVRVKGKLRVISEELMNLVENQEKSEKKQRGKLHWLQEQLKTKEDEVKTQSEYFEHYKQRQKRQTTMQRERECYLRGEVSRLEKQVLDLNAHIALLTSELEEGMVQCLQQKLESASTGTQGYKLSEMEVTELKTCIENIEHDMKSHVESFQQNLKFLREKGEDNRREQADLVTELQCSQDTEDFLRRKLEESCNYVYNLKLSEIKLQKQVEDLLDENRVLKDQGRVKLKKKEEKDSQRTHRLENGDSSADLNGDLVQDDVQNLKWGAVSDTLRNRATQTPVVLLHAKEYETPGCSFDGLKQTEKLWEEILPVLEQNSGPFANISEELGLAEIKLVTLGTKRPGGLEASFTLFRCTPSYPVARLFSPCSEKLTNDETCKEIRDEEYFSPLKKQTINLPTKMFPVSVVEALMRNEPHLTLLKPESYHVEAVTMVKKVRSLNFSNADTALCSDGLCVAEQCFSEKASVVLHGNPPCFVSDNFTSYLEKCCLEKHQQSKQILPKNKCKSLDRVNDIKYHQKIFRRRVKGEEIHTEKAQAQQVTCVFEENSEVLNKTVLIRPGKHVMDTKDKPDSPEGVHNISVDFKDLQNHFNGSLELKKKQKTLSTCISDVTRTCNRGNIMKVEEKGEKPHKPTYQINSSRNIGLKEKKDQSVKLHKSKEKNFSCQKVSAENTQYAYPQKSFWSEEESYPLKILSPMQKRAVCVSKEFLPESDFYEYFCHLSPPEAVNEHNVKIHTLKKAVAMCSQRIFLLMQENENYSEKVCLLQEENERYVHKMCALEEEMNAYFQYALEVDEANIASFQSLLNENEVAGIYNICNNISEENRMSPGTIFAENFSKNLSYVEDKNRNSEKDSLRVESNHLPKSVLSLSERKMRYLQLLSDLKEERSRCFIEIAKLLQDKENYVAKYNELIQERERNLHRISLLEDEKETLLRSLAEVKCQQDKYQALVSELQECKTSCYQTISDLQEEKCVLKRTIDRIKKETAEQFNEFQKANANLIVENNKLKELMSSSCFTYEDLRKEKCLGTKENVVNLKEENRSQQHDLNPKKVETSCSITQTEEEGVDPSSYFPSKEGSMFESYSVMKEQVENAKEELKIKQKELEKSKKEAQKWYRELGFAETRYEEIKTRLIQVLSELDHLKQEAGDKMLQKQHCKFMPVYNVEDAQEIEDNKIANKRLQQQVLTLKAQLRDQAALQNQFHSLQNEVELLQTQLCEKTKELQKRKSDVKLMLAPLKAKLACLTRKCQERNSFITRMHSEFHQQGFKNSAFDEEVRCLVNDMAMAEYSATFTPMCDQEMLPSSTDISEASGQPEDHETYVRVNRMIGSKPANSVREVDGIHSSHISPNVYASSPIKLRSPEKIIALHRELRQNHCKNCQIPSADPSNANPTGDRNLPMIQEETPWPPLSKMKETLKPSEHGASWAIKGRDRLSKRDDVFWGQIGNQHAGAIPQGKKQKNVITNNAWLSRDKTDGSTSATTAKNYLSDVLSASNKG